MGQDFCSTFLGARRGQQLRMRARSSGFTLLELMIVVAIVGIIAAIAYPAYQNSVLQGRRAQGKSAILSSLQAEERYYSLNNTYVAYGAPPTGLPATFMTSSGSDGSSAAAYTLAAAACPGGLALTQCIGITATPVIADPTCGALYADTTGVETSSPPDPTCWR